MRLRGANRIRDDFRVGSLLCLRPGTAAAMFSLLLFIKAPDLSTAVLNNHDD